MVGNDQSVLSNNNGMKLAHSFKEFLALLEAELCHEKLPVALHSVANKGLQTITGFNLAEWNDLLEEFINALKAAERDQSNPVIDRTLWLEHLTRLRQFINIIPEETSRFYDDDILHEIEPMCDQGNKIIDEMSLWMNEHTFFQQC